MMVSFTITLEVVLTSSLTPLLVNSWKGMVYWVLFVLMKLKMLGKYSLTLSLTLLWTFSFEEKTDIGLLPHLLFDDMNIDIECIAKLKLPGSLQSWRFSLHLITWTFTIIKRQFWNMKTMSWTLDSLIVVLTLTGYLISWTFSLGVYLSLVRKVCLIPCFLALYSLLSDHKLTMGFSFFRI